MLIKKKRIPIKQIVFIGLLPSFLKKAIYRLKGYKIGKKVKISLGSVVIGDHVEIGEGTNIGFLTIIRGKNIKINRFVNIGSLSVIDTPNIEIDDDTKINEQVYVGGISSPRSLFKLGKRTIVMQMTYINPAEEVIVGDDSGIGGHCLLFTHGSWLSQLDGFPVTFSPIKLGKNVWLPWRVFVMPGVEIGDNVVIGANSLVSKSIPPNSLAAGSPAKVIVGNYPKKLTEEDKSVVWGSILNSFVEFMNFNGLDTHLENLANHMEIHVQTNKQLHKIAIFNEFNNETQLDDFSLLVLTKQTDLLSDNLLKRTNMVVYLELKSRIGSSKVGEEFLKYISRFGLRFNRLD